MLGDDVCMYMIVVGMLCEVRSLEIYKFYCDCKEF